MHTDLSLKYLLAVPSKRPDTDPMPLVILMHGRGADAHDLADLAPLLDVAPGCRFVFPNAPRPWEASPGMTFGWTWFDGWPPEAGSLAASRELLIRFIGEATARYPTTSLIIAGFSQGAMMALDAGLRIETAGIVAMSGGLYEFPAGATPRPVFIGHGALDDVVPVINARRARLELEAHGFDVDYHEYPMGHQIVMEEMQLVRAFLERTLTP